MISPSLQTRGHPHKLFKAHCGSTIRINVFEEKVINVWNFLPSTVNF